MLRAMAKAPARYSVADAQAAIDAHCVRLARQLRSSARRVIGVLPSSDDVAAWPLVLELGLSLAHITGAGIAALDVEHRWPELVPALVGEGTGPADALPELPVDDNLYLYSMTLLTPTFVLLAPRETIPKGAKVHMLDLMLSPLRQEKAVFQHVLVDLTGFEERIGEFLGGVDLVDGVITVGRVAVTLEQDLVRLQRELPKEKNLGVLLVD